MGTQRSRSGREKGGFGLQDVLWVEGRSHTVDLASRFPAVARGLYGLFGRGGP